MLSSAAAAREGLKPGRAEVSTKVAAKCAIYVDKRQEIVYNIYVIR